MSLVNLNDSTLTLFSVLWMFFVVNHHTTAVASYLASCISGSSYQLYLLNLKLSTDFK